MSSKPPISRKPRLALLMDLLQVSLLMIVSGQAFAQLTESAPRMTPIKVRVSRPVEQQLIPETLFGSFLEPIGHSIYGGLWADVVENPSFEAGLWSPTNVEAILRDRPELRRASDLSLPLPWEPLYSSQGNRYAPIRGDAANSAQSILIMGLPSKEVGVSQRVYLPVARELTYNGDVWLKHLRGDCSISISLRRRAHPELTLAAATICAKATKWSKYQFSLSLKDVAVQRLEPVDLVLSLSDDARVQIDNLHLNPADAVSGMDPDVITLARDLHSPLVRFGGNFTSAYDWRDGIGPSDTRVSKLNTAWGIPEYNTFGTDEFLRFCQMIKAHPQFALNLGTGTPEEAAEWVRYVDDHLATSKTDNLWELGNELWDKNQIGYPTQERIAAATLSTSQAVRKVDPSARLIATGGDEDSFHDWNAQQLANPPGTFNFLSTHFVDEDQVQLREPSDEFRNLATLAMPWGLTKQMQAIHRQILESKNQQIKIAFTEWLIVSSSHKGPDNANMGGALYASSFLNMLVRNSGMISIADMTGIVEFGGIWKKRGQVYATPAYWVLREYASARPSSLLTVTSNSPTYSVTHGNVRLPEVDGVPYVDVVAATENDPSKIVLFCLNRHPSRAQTVDFDLSALGVQIGPARVRTLTAESISVVNDEMEPSRVVPTLRTVNLQKGVLQCRLLNSSVTVIELDLLSQTPKV